MSARAQQLIETATVARSEGRLQDALRDVNSAVSLCRESGDQPGLITSLKAVGHIEADLGNHAGSRAAYAEAVERSRKTGNARVLAHSLRHLADASARLGEPGRAEVLYEEALALYAHYEAARLDQANALRALARLMDATSRQGDAVELWKKARDLYAAEGVQAGVLEASARLGMPSGV